MYLVPGNLYLFSQDAFSPNLSRRDTLMIGSAVDLILRPAFPSGSACPWMPYGCWVLLETSARLPSLCIASSWAWGKRNWSSTEGYSLVWALGFPLSTIITSTMTIAIIPATVILLPIASLKQKKNVISNTCTVHLVLNT